MQCHISASSPADADKEVAPTTIRAFGFIHTLRKEISGAHTNPQIKTQDSRVKKKENTLELQSALCCGAARGLAL